MSKMTRQDKCYYCQQTVGDYDPICHCCGESYCVEHMEIYNEVSSIHNFYIRMQQCGYHISNDDINKLADNISAVIKIYPNKKLYKGCNYIKLHNCNKYFSASDSTEHVNEVISLMNTLEKLDFYLSEHFIDKFPFICNECCMDKICMDMCHHCESCSKYKRYQSISNIESDDV